uniref:Potassium channel tetramerisation-type BTB domain-containing protein n=1 Tax=Ditylenchus dipsaci TaxID=166011 RepID=A0A915CQ68_9BILA
MQKSKQIRAAEVRETDEVEVKALIGLSLSLSRIRYQNLLCSRSEERSVKVVVVPQVQSSFFSHILLQTDERLLRADASAQAVTQGPTNMSTDLTEEAAEMAVVQLNLFAGDGLDVHKQVARRLPDGIYFVDRDGDLFAYILDYLRSGKLLLRTASRRWLGARRSDILPTRGSPNPLCETGGFITLGYRGTFAFGRDGQADVKFRKLHRILVCGKAALCREVFSDTLNESRDPDREGLSDILLACDNLAEKGFKLVTACSSGANGLTTAAIQAQTGATQVDFQCSK